MLTLEQSTLITAQTLKDRILTLMQRASTEITPAERIRLTQLQSILPAGTLIYVAHTPSASFEEVISAALEVQRSGFVAVPHVAVRRIADGAALHVGLRRLRAAGIERVLLIGGDAPHPIGSFSSTLQVLESSLLQDCGISSIGVAGHPQGHNAVPTVALWEALRAKQAWAVRHAVQMHITTQFGLDASAFAAWQRELAAQRIVLPVRVGIAGPASLPKLARFALQCGVAASLRALVRNLSTAAQAPELALTPDQHLLSLASGASLATDLAPHFFAFGGAVQTARWMRQVNGGAFDLDLERGRLVL